MVVSKISLILVGQNKMGKSFDVTKVTIKSFKLYRSVEFSHYDRVFPSWFGQTL